MKFGVVDVGGGLRGIYATGIFDYCIDHHVKFDLGIGVSAGSANIASYAAGQRGRNYKFYTEYAFRKQYMSLRNFIIKKSYIDMDYVYETLSNSNGENPLDYCSIIRNDMELYVVATESSTGCAKYFDKTNMKQDDYSILKASCAIPLVCQPFELQGISYFDGGLSDPVPIRKAFSLGCDKVVVILTKPESIELSNKYEKKLAYLIRKRYPEAAKQLCSKAKRYNESVLYAKKLAKQGKVLIISPDNTCGVDTLKKNKKSLINLYNKGYNDAEKILPFLLEK